VCRAGAGRPYHDRARRRARRRPRRGAQRLLLPRRAGAGELALLLGGLLFARFLAGPSLLSAALALWGFLLMQSFFFLVAGGRSQATARDGDPFEQAHRRALALLE
jgi:hypothetical protein